MKHKTRFRTVVSIIALCLFLSIQLCLLIGTTLVYESPNIEKADVIVILGNPSNPDGGPSDTMKSRVDRGVELFKRGYAPKIIMTGSSVGNQFVEADVMAQYAESLGVDVSAIITETHAQDTIQNARNSAEIMRANHWTSAIVVTSPYHTRRAYNLVSQYGLDKIIMVVAKPTEEISVPQRVGEILHELEAYIWYFLSGISTQ